MQEVTKKLLLLDENSLIEVQSNKEISNKRKKISAQIKTKGIKKKNPKFY
jgi:hypothetical protein